MLCDQFSMEGEEVNQFYLY